MLGSLPWGKNARDLKPLTPLIDLRFGWLFVLALLLQAAAIYGIGSDRSTDLLKLMILASYVLLLLGVSVNLHRWGIRIIGLGRLMNFIVILANGGLMPVSPESLAQADLQDRITQVTLGDALPRSKDILLLREETRLWFLSDTIPVSSPIIRSVFSPGDVVIGLGLAIILREGFTRLLGYIRVRHLR